MLGAQGFGHTQWIGTKGESPCDAKVSSWVFSWRPRVKMSLGVDTYLSLLEAGGAWDR